jgi:hypothetical protein
MLHGGDNIEGDLNTITVLLERINTEGRLEYSSSTLRPEITISLSKERFTIKALCIYVCPLGSPLLVLSISNVGSIVLRCRRHIQADVKPSAKNAERHTV